MSILHRLGVCMDWYNPLRCKNTKDVYSSPHKMTNTNLDTVEYSNTHTFVPDISFGKVVKVYDGDTFTVANRISVDGGHSYSTQIYRFNVRLHGIDSPELKTKNATTKHLAIQSRDALHDLIYGKIVQLKNVSLEKYGRLLADIYIGDIHVNQWMLDQKYAVAYDGGAKHIPEEWETVG